MLTIRKKTIFLNTDIGVRCSNRVGTDEEHQYRAVGQGTHEHIYRSSFADGGGSWQVLFLFCFSCTFLIDVA